jgi:general secretion pathway protein N
MKQSIKWILLGLLAYVGFLIAKLPAIQVISRLQLPTNISVIGVSGTIWQGQAMQLTINTLPVDKLEWQLSFWPLLWGKAKLDVKAGNIRQSEDVSFSGLLWLGKNSVAAENFSLYLPSDLVIAQLPLPIAVNAKGRFSLKLNELEYLQGCQTLSGKGQWLNAEVMGLQNPITLGTFNAELSCIDNDVLISVKEPNSFGLSARARVPNNLQFSVEGRFKPDPSLPKEVQQAAQFFGKPDAEGYYPVAF